MTRYQRYNRTEKGKARKIRYNKSQKGMDRIHRWNHSAKRLAASRKYERKETSKFLRSLHHFECRESGRRRLLDAGI